MARPRSRFPTELELDILKTIWRSGPATVRQVRESLEPQRSLAHTSVMTVMNIMVDKGYLRRRKARQGAGYVYQARVTERVTCRRMLRDLVTRAFDGSTLAMVQRLLDVEALDADELSSLRKLIDRKMKETES